MLRAFSLALLGALAVAAPASAAIGGTVTLGLVASQTGSAAAYGASQLQGAQLAVQQLTKSELGYTLALDVKDDASTPDGAKAAFTALLGDNVTALLGPTLSGAALAADPLVQAAGRPLVAISNTADGINAIGPYVFRASLTEREVIPAAVAVASKRFKIKRPVMITRSDQPFAVAGAKAFGAALKKSGAPVLAEQTYTGAPASFAALLAKLAAKKPDALVINSLSEGPQLMKEARKLKAFKKVHFLGGNAFNSSAVVKDAGSAAEGLIVGAAWHPAEKSPTSRLFVSSYKRKFGKTPDQFAAQAYTGVMVTAFAIANAGSTDPAKVRAELAATKDFDTPLGRFGFDKSRGAVVGAVVQIVRDGKFVLLS